MNSNIEYNLKNLSFIQNIADIGSSIRIIGA